MTLLSDDTYVASVTAMKFVNAPAALAGGDYHDLALAADSPGHLADTVNGLDAGVDMDTLDAYLGGTALAPTIIIITDSCKDFSATDLVLSASLTIGAPGDRLILVQTAGWHHTFIHASVTLNSIALTKVTGTHVEVPSASAGGNSHNIQWWELRESGLAGLVAGTYTLQATRATPDATNFGTYSYMIGMALTNVDQTNPYRLPWTVNGRLGPAPGTDTSDNRKDVTIPSEPGERVVAGFIGINGLASAPQDGLLQPPGVVVEEQDPTGGSTPDAFTNGVGTAVGASPTVYMTWNNVPGPGNDMARVPRLACLSCPPTASPNPPSPAARSW